MNGKISSSLIITLLVGAATATAAETPLDLPGDTAPAPNIAGETSSQVKERTGYTIQDLKEDFPPIEEWSALGVELDPGRLAASYAKDRLKAPPPAGVHLRVYFNPEDVPVIRQRLQESLIARTRWELTRGRHPYALVVDDCRKDDSARLYQWLMQVPDDVQIAERSVGTPGKDKVLDLVLSEKEGDRRLLFRVLAAGAGPAEAKRLQTEAKLETYDKQDRKTVTRHQRICLPLESTVGHFIVLLCPYRQRDPLPVTTWSGSDLRIAWRDQADQYAFARGTDGRTRLSLERDRKRILSVK